MCFLNIFDMKTLYIQKSNMEKTKTDSRDRLESNKPGN